MNSFTSTSSSNSGGSAISFGRPRPSIHQSFDYALAVGKQRSSCALLRSYSEELSETMTPDETRPSVSRRNSWANAKNLSATTDLDSTDSSSFDASSYLFPLCQLFEVDHRLRNLNLTTIRSLEPLTSGSNSELFRGEYQGRPVVVKMVSERESQNEIALLEFDMELELLQRCSHPNIMGFIGAGAVPRRFIVLDHLSGGTLSDRLLEGGGSRSPPNLADTLNIGIQLADALDYLHHRFHPQACIIHRDVKPENIGFSSNGSIVLFDFGLSACVRKFHSSISKYEMSGCTGSLRYMAPEVALGIAYNHKVDVYSYAMVIWQTASGKIPFNGASKSDYVRYVVHGGMRPLISPRWPTTFGDVLSRAWDQNIDIRPEFSEIQSTFQDLLDELNIP